MGQKSREKWKRRLAVAVTPWTAFERAYLEPEKLAQLQLKSQPILFKNSRYQVSIRKVKSNVLPPGWPEIVHLSIKRLDKEPIHDWRDLQRIKNELIGPEYEAVEVYPAESRLVDDANQFHLWVFMDETFRLPFGFAERLVSEGSTFGSKQRPFPKDAIPEGLRHVDDSEISKTMKEIK